VVQPLGLSAAHNDAYLARLFGSHDYTVTVDVLNLDEQPVGSVHLLDGQINIQDTSATVRRTATLTVSDPAGAFDFTGASTWSGSTVWVDRLIRVRHTINVPGLGDVTVTPFIGPPSTLTRQGSEVSVECQDKTALAIRGASPFTVAKGANAVTAIHDILAKCTGEFRFRLGTTSRRLSTAYSVGWADEASPWTVASAIAVHELGAQLIYSCDGYATLRGTPTKVGIIVPHVTSDPQSAVDFTTLSNWVDVTGKTTSVTKKNVTTTTQPEATAVVTSGSVAPATIARKGVKRYLPLVIAVDTYTTTTQVKNRAASELAKASRVQAQPTFNCVPFFHADYDDIIQFSVPGNDVQVAFTSGSIPLGPNEMSVGSIKWASKTTRTATATRINHTRTVAPKKKTTSKPTKKHRRK
jgi:hypothetical protein